MFFSYTAPSTSMRTSMGHKTSLFNSYMATAALLSFGFFTVLIIGMTSNSSTFWSNSTLAAIFVFVCLLFAWHYVHLYVNYVKSLDGKMTLSGRTILHSPSVLMAAGEVAKARAPGEVPEEGGGDSGLVVKLEASESIIEKAQSRNQLASHIEAARMARKPCRHSRRTARIASHHYLEYLMQLKDKVEYDKEGKVVIGCADCDVEPTKKERVKEGDGTSLVSSFSVLASPPPYDLVVKGADDAEDQQSAHIPEEPETPPPDYFLSSAKENLFFL